MKILEIITQPEGRRLEFKEALPTVAELVKTIIAFANDAGGELFIGIKDTPRQIIGIHEDALIAMEEKISNMIFDQCVPVILPEISFIQVEGKYVIRIQIHKGGNPPYYQKTKTIQDGTFIRVGSSNRLASAEMVAELMRQRQNTSFDSELSYIKDVENLDIEAFSKQFSEVTGELLNHKVLVRLDLIRTEQGRQLATNALILLSDDELRRKLFPFASVECARFKGTTPGNFIDQKTIDVNIGLQAEHAYQFVLRHISKSSAEYVGVYRNDRWEYPVIAIREAIRNAIIHRDYSLTGKDVKIAIFDDKIEITSPGKLLPSVDFDDMESGQSDIRNKILAPVFKKLGIIEKWGNGLQLIANELKGYPEIGFDWKEPGLSFRVVFFKKNFVAESAEGIQSVKNALQYEGGDTTIKNPETTIKPSETTIKNIKTTIENPNTTINKDVEALFASFGFSDIEKAHWPAMKTAEKIIFLLTRAPHLSSGELADLIGNITFHGINYHLKNLVAAGSIKHLGSKKGGYWEVIIPDFKK